MQRLAPLFAIALALTPLACDDGVVQPGASDVAGADTADTASPADTASDSHVADTSSPSDTHVGLTDTATPDSAPTDSGAPGDIAGTTEVVFEVRVPADTPDGGVFVSGNQPELGDWDGQGVALTRASDGRWSASVRFAPGTELAFKVTRGSWDTVEKGASGEEIDNHTASVGAAAETVDVAVAGWRDLVPTPPSPARIDFIRGVHSQFVPADRDVEVYLPPGYDSSPNAHYPVLYMHDGQNLFDAATSAFGVAWEIDDTATALIESGEIEPIIIVGIDNTNDRFAEYTPVPDSEYGGGNADNYGRFIVEELKPDIDATYRTEPEPAVTGLCGSSLGGLVSMYLGLTRSDVFQRIGVVSPSVWWANRDIVDRVNALAGHLPLHIWLDIGTAEGGGSEALDDARTLRDALVGKGWVLGQDLLYGEYPGAEHNEASWAARSDDILRGLYPR